MHEGGAERSQKLENRNKQIKKNVWSNYVVHRRFIFNIEKNKVEITLNKIATIIFFLTFVFKIDSIKWEKLIWFNQVKRIKIILVKN